MEMWQTDSLQLYPLYRRYCELYVNLSCCERDSNKVSDTALAYCNIAQTEGSRHFRVSADDTCHTHLASRAKADFLMIIKSRGADC